MAYISSIERRGLQKGLEQGLRKGLERNLILEVSGLSEQELLALEKS